MKTNCLFHAVTLWVTRGGWLIIRRSQKDGKANWYPHFIHAQELPEDMPCSQYVAKDGVPCNIVFDGEIRKDIGPVKPPQVIGYDGANLGFCLLIAAGLIALLVSLIA
jgi:hypothetical protein